MDYSKITRYTEIFQKLAEHGPDHDPFTKVIEQADAIIQKALSDNNKYYSREYFGGNPFNVKVVNADPNTSVIFVATSPIVQEAKGIQPGTNKIYFENEMDDKVSPLGVTVKVK